MHHVYSYAFKKNYYSSGKQFDYRKENKFQDLFKQFLKK